MNKETLIQLFKAPYKRQAFIDNGLLPTFQGKVANLKIYDAQGLQPIELTASEQNYAVSAVKYGEFQTLEEIPRTVELYEIIVNDNKQIERSRVGLGALVKKHIIGNNAVLVNFAYQNPEKRTWRFSFIARDGVFQDGEMQITDTHPKRYTYVFGEKEETYKTALDRFFILGNELEITINKIKDAFGVEAMSKAFFDEYRDVHYAGFVDYLMRSNFKKSAFNGNDKDVRDFVKKLLGRIVFLYFLQKKGWLGAKDTSYKNGDKNFMTNFFEKAGANDAFYANWLSKLFFDALNNERPNDDFTMPDGEVVKIPYLNGGLFEKETEKYDYLTFPADLFSNLFEFFDQYNFTIFEDSPEEHTVAVDPEMLGHIFENLLEDNKDKGAFYTPKEIVHYMTQESLIEYLHTQLTDADRTELENFVKNKDNKLSKEHKAAIDQKLDTVKICDPAIGSGAFPMGLLQEIFGLKERIAYDLGYKVWSPATVKENIIQKSIYGVDIERGAVDIARLRFWLSLIVDEEMPKALPNLDYKIVVGNSLVSKFDDTVIEIDWDEKSRAGRNDANLTQMRKDLVTISEKQKHFFESKDHTEKAQLKAELRDLKLDILINQLTFNKTAYQNRTPIKGGFAPNAKEIKFNLERELQIAEFDQNLTKLKNLKDNPDQDFNHFDWKLDFPEVLNPLVNEETGFDIVIGNPPYIEFKNLDSNLKKHLSKYSTTNGKYDVYIPFTELSLLISKYRGSVLFINPTRYMHRDYGKDLRVLISKNVTLKSIIDFGNIQNFENAITYTGIYHYQNAKPETAYTFAYKNNLHEESLYFNSEFLNSDVWYFNNDDSQKILNKIKLHTHSLRSGIEGIYQGVATGKDAVFVVSPEDIQKHNLEMEFLVKWLKGKDIAPYKINWSGNYCIYPYNENGDVINEDKLKTRAPNTYKYLSERKEQLSGRGYFEKSNKRWFELWNQRNKKRFERVKIVTLDTASKNSFTYDDNGFFGTTTTYSLITEDKSIIKPLLAILNSKVLNFYHKKNTIPQAGGYFRYQASFIENLPIIDNLSTNIKYLLSNIVTSILFLNKDSKSSIKTIPNTHISEAFEEVIDALVFELYFPEEFAEKGIAIEKYAKDIFKPIEGLSEDEQIKAIQEAYETLREKDNPLRNQIKLMKIELKELLLPILSV